MDSYKIINLSGCSIDELAVFYCVQNQNFIPEEIQNIDNVLHMVYNKFVRKRDVLPYQKLQFCTEPYNAVRTLYGQRL